MAEHLATLLGLILLGIHALGLLSAGFAVMETRTPQGAIAWTIALISFPYLALPLYWVFGRSRFVGYVERLRELRHQHTPQAGELTRATRRHRAYIDNTPAGSFAVLEKLSYFPFTHGNSMKLLVDGQATFDAVFQAIDSAREYILLQFYIVRDDELGGELRGRLLRKAAEGIRVHFLYDELGCYKLPKTYIEALRSGGVSIHPFSTTKGRRNRLQMNFRNHRKIVVVDGAVAFVGGLNVGDEYMGRDPHFGHWRDTHMRITGPAVQSVQLTFLADWYWATDDSLRVNTESRVSDEANQTAIVLPCGPADEYETGKLFFAQAIETAKKRLWITSPYFVPDAHIFDALRLAALRGVDVRILLADKIDHLIVYLAAFAFLPEAIRAGIKVYRYGNGFLHQKVVLIDDECASVGTANLDNRSMRLNFEITVLVADRAFTGQVAEMLERDFALSQPATAADYLDRSLAFRIAVRTARLLDPIL